MIGPWAVANKSTLWYWGGRIALLSSSLPIAAFFNRNPQSFGRLIGTWVVFRNFFEYGLHIVVAAIAVRWDLYYLLLWWIVAYRYLDVGPRRALQKLYGTPELQGRAPWAPVLNWAVIASLYVLTFFVVANELLVFAKVPGDDVPVHDAGDLGVRRRLRRQPRARARRVDASRGIHEVAHAEGRRRSGGPGRRAALSRSAPLARWCGVARLAASGGGPVDGPPEEELGPALGPVDLGVGLLVRRRERLLLEARRQVA